MTPEKLIEEFEYAVIARLSAGGGAERVHEAKQALRAAIEVTGEAAPAEGVKDDYKQWRDKLLELIAEYADVWRDYHQREAKWDQVEATRKAMFSHLAMGAQRGSAGDAACLNKGDCA